MRMIRPITITPAMITACNVPETDRTAWSSGTAYTIGMTCMYNHKLYTCLVNHTNAQPDLNVAPVVSPKWFDDGYDNRWRMLDAVVGSQTAQATSITISLVPGGTNNYDSLAILNCEGATIKVSIPSTGFSDTFTMSSSSHINNAYSYFFDPIILTDTLCIVGMTPTTGQIDITINNPAGTAKAGTVVMGMQMGMGDTQYNPTIGIIDYSKKDVDIYGNTTVLQRAYAKRMSCEMSLPNTDIDNLQRTLAMYRATPLVWVGADVGYSCMIVFGFYKSFSINIAYPTYSICNIEIEGLS